MTGGVQEEEVSVLSFWISVLSWEKFIETKSVISVQCLFKSEFRDQFSHKRQLVNG